MISTTLQKYYQFQTEKQMLEKIIEQLNNSFNVKLLQIKSEMYATQKEFTGQDWQDIPFNVDSL